MSRFTMAATTASYLRHSMASWSPLASFEDFCLTLLYPILEKMRLTWIYYCRFKLQTSSTSSKASNWWPCIYRTRPFFRAGRYISLLRWDVAYGCRGSNSTIPSVHRGYLWRKISSIACTTNWRLLSIPWRPTSACSSYSCYMSASSLISSCLLPWTYLLITFDTGTFELVD